MLKKIISICGLIIIIKYSSYAQIIDEKFFIKEKFIEQVYNTSVGIRSSGTTFGSGVIIGKDEEGYYVITNYHVVGPLAGKQKEVEIHWKDGGMSKKILKGKVVKSFKTDDISIIKIKDKNIELPVAEIASVRELLNLPLLSQVVFCGYLNTEIVVVSFGLVIEKSFMLEDNKIYWISTTYNTFGFSGGGIYCEINGQWKLVGISSKILMSNNENSQLGNYLIDWLSVIKPITKEEIEMIVLK